MSVSNPHNLNDKTPRESGRFGIRISLPTSDPLNNLLDADWETYHWFETESERDEVLADKAGKHLYSRIGDQPTLIFEKVER